MPASLFLTPRARMLAIAGAIGIAVALVFSIQTRYVTNNDFRLQDWLMSEVYREQAGKSVLVAIDEDSTRLSAAEPEEVAASRALQLMQPGFPWSREVYALAARQLLEAGAKVVVFDLTFPGPREGDPAFAEVLKEFPGRIVIGCSFDRLDSMQKAESYVFQPPTPGLGPAAEEAAGFVNLPPTDGIIRWFRPWATGSVIGSNVWEVKPHPDENLLPALSTKAALFAGAALPPSTALKRIRYLGPDAFRTVSLYELFVPAVMEANYDSGRIFQDRVVLIGATAALQQDYHNTPMGRMSGPEIQLNAIETILDGAFFNQPGFVFVLASIIVPGLLVYLLSVLRKNVRWFLIGWLGGVAGWLLLCWAAFTLAHFFLPMAYPLGTWILCGFINLACDVSWEKRERGRMRSTLERYVSRDVVREIVDNPTSFLQSLGGQRKEVTVLFSDLQGFTAESEKLDPSEMVALLNGYFIRMVDVIFAGKGTLDKFIGDAIMATWGGVTSGGLEDDARRAVHAAIDMQDRLAALNAERDGRWGMGIGVCQGPAVFGNIGSQQKMEPTVIGDTVNLASRIEGLTRTYGCSILVNEQVATRLDDHTPALFLDAVRVKGRKKPERLYFPYRADGPEASWAHAFSEARKLYQEGRFAEAERAFAALSSGPARCFAARCRHLQDEPPKAGWDGVWEFTSK